ncbi:transporter substrate-binding domain-containing protein, partial [Bacteroides graminisolvens]|uniref:transporter substrate-binding domain-containing protein n=1 Tax=Bacteroides graminisolvens TaxID=477666 RepID=UPI003B6ACEAB
MKDSGELVVLTLYSSTSYFIYRGQEMGFQYELSEQFAKSLGLKLRIEVARNVPDLVRKLRNGEGDMIAYNLPITKALKDSVTYCGEEVVTHQVIVQRAGGKGKVLTDVTQLVGKEVYVKPGKYFDRLTNLNKELGGGIKIRKVEADSITVEDLITQVYQGKIDYTVCDNDLARLNTTYYPNLDIRLPISFDQRASWAVRKECPLLAEAANKWHKENLTSPAYNASMKRYFE